MTEKEKFDKSVGVLVNAYLNSTLQHRDGCGCVIGNLVAAACGLRLSRYNLGAAWDEKGMEPDWFVALCEVRFQETRNAEEVRKGKEQIESTGYTIQQIDRIEAAFESVYIYDDIDGYKGLMKVVDVLADIHHVELSDVNEAKAMFVKT